MTGRDLPESALSDVETALDHYLTEAGAVVGGRFLAAFADAIRLIEGQPGIGSPRYAMLLSQPNLRVWPVRGFPYLIFYLDLPQGLQIWRVLHAQRDIPRSLRE